MNIDLDEAVVRLNPGRNFQVKDANGACVHVHWGDLWITQEGDPADHILRAGESFAVDRAGLTFMSAINDAGVSLMKKCSETAIADVATIGEIVPSSPTRADDANLLVRTVRHDDSDYGAAKHDFQEADTEDLTRVMLRAKRYRARFVSDLINRVRNALQRSIGTVREFG